MHPGRALPKELLLQVSCRGLGTDSDPVRRRLGGILPVLARAGSPHSLHVASNPVSTRISSPWASGWGCCPQRPSRGLPAGAEDKGWP